METVRRGALAAAAGTLLLAATVAAEAEGENYLPYVFAAFGVTWTVFFVYAFFMSRKQAELQRELDALKRGGSEDGGAP